MAYSPTREVNLAMTHKQGHRVLYLLDHEKRKLERSIARSKFVPAPGKFHADKMRLAMMEDLIAQLQPQLTENRDHDRKNATAGQPVPQGTPLPIA